jgi:hypothetical protein
MRFTAPFWRSRLIGEGHHHAITNRMFFGKSAFSLIRTRLSFVRSLNRWKSRLEARLAKCEQAFSETGFDGVLTEELYVHYCKHYLEMDAVLWGNRWLGPYLWDIGTNGVSTHDFSAVVEKLPKRYLRITDPSVMYFTQPITSPKALSLFCKGNMLGYPG